MSAPPAPKIVPMCLVGVLHYQRLQPLASPELEILPPGPPFQTGDLQNSEKCA